MAALQPQPIFVSAGPSAPHARSTRGRRAVDARSTRGRFCPVCSVDVAALQQPCSSSPSAVLQPQPCGSLGNRALSTVSFAAVALEQHGKQPSSSTAAAALWQPCSWGSQCSFFRCGLSGAALQAALQPQPSNPAAAALRHQPRSGPAAAALRQPGSRGSSVQFLSLQPLWSSTASSPAAPAPQQPCSRSRYSYRQAHLL